LACELDAAANAMPRVASSTSGPRLKKAIQACEAALEIYTQRDFPVDCGHDLSPPKRGLRAAPGVFWEKNIAPDAIAV
jgi:hypothetical protein